MWFFAFGLFICPKDEWAYLSIGWYIEFEVAAKNPQYGLFAEFEWRGGRDVEWDRRAAYEYFSKFPSEPTAQQILRRVLKEAQAKVKRVAPPPYRAIMSRLVVS